MLQFVMCITAQHVVYKDTQMTHNFAYSCKENKRVKIFLRILRQVRRLIISDVLSTAAML